jgi:hypothetical protein
MQVVQRIKKDGAWAPSSPSETSSAQLALVFSTPDALGSDDLWKELRAAYPAAQIVGCSTAGEIADVNVLDDSVVCTSINFERSRIVAASVRLDEASDSAALGTLLVSRLPLAGLVHVLVLSDGLHVNGSALTHGISASLPHGVAVTGGLSGDGPRFQRTAVCLNGPHPSQQVVAIGLYGESLRIGYGSLGGWDPFGPERRITRAAGNVLYELDGEPALQLYKRYLGEHAAALPASGLLFPLTIRGETADEQPVVRTILAVDEQANSLTFAGDVPTGHRARLMKANLERLVDGAAGAARATHTQLRNGQSDLALLVSCVGRKLVLKQRVEEEVEAVRDVLGPHCALTGFYSYGEIAPFVASARCELHNQTMTITTIAER